MTNIDLARISSQDTQDHRRGDGAKVTRVNTVTFWVMLATMALAPIPFGSARALYWALLAMLFGLTAALYFACLIWVRGAPRIGFSRFWPQAAIWLMTCGWLVVQVLPLGMAQIVLADGSTLEAATISISPGPTLLMLARQLGYGLFFFLMLQVTANENRRKYLLDALLCIIVVHGVYGMVSLQSGDTILGLEKWAYNGYATGTFVNRNSFATFLAIGGIIAAGRFSKVLGDGLRRHKDDGRSVSYRSTLVIYGVAYIFLLTVIFSTASRMGAFVTLVGTAVVVAVSLRGLRSVIALLALLPAIGVVLLLYGPALFERVGDVEVNALVRGDFYRQLWELIMLRPLTGFGGGSFELAYPLVHAAPVDSDKVWNLAHNTYLGLWSELGLVVGSLVILSVFLVAIRIVRAVIMKRGNLETQAIAMGVVTACALHSLVDFSLEIPANTLVFLAVLAAGAASTVTIKNRNRTV